MKIKKIILVPFNYLKQFFISGFIFILPIAITFAIFKFFFSLIQGWLVPLRNISIPLINKIPYHEFFFVLVVIILIGLCLRFFILQIFVNYIEIIFGKLPIIRTIYFGLKQLITAFTSKDKVSFQKVVIVEFPLKNVYSIGFLTSAVVKKISPDSKTDFVYVYIPTTPNPTTGFFIMIEAYKVVSTDLTRQEAISLIISGGIIHPERFSKEVELILKHKD